MAMQSPNVEGLVNGGVRIFGNTTEQREALPRIGTKEYERWQDTGELPVAKVIGGYEEVTENGGYDA